MKFRIEFSVVFTLAFATLIQQSFAQGASRDGWAFNSFNNTGASATWDFNFWRANEGPGATYARRLGFRHQILSPEPYEEIRTYFQNGTFETFDEYGWGRGYYVGDPFSPRFNGGVGMRIGEGTPDSSSVEISFSLFNPTIEETALLFTSDFDTEVSGDSDFSYLSDFTEDSIEFTTIGERSGRYDAVSVRVTGPNLYAFEQSDSPTLYSNLSQPWYQLSNESIEYTGNAGNALDYYVVVPPGASQIYNITVLVQRNLF